MISEFLVVLVVSLAFGNGLLYFTSKKEKTEMVSLKEQIQDSTEVNSQETNLSGSVYIDEIYSLQASLRGVNEKIKLAHERINELELVLANMNSSLNSVPSASFPAEEKIKQLEEFKRRTKIELEAIKKLLKQLKEFRKIKGKKSLSAKKTEEKLNKRIHELVFNTKKTN